MIIIITMMMTAAASTTKFRNIFFDNYEIIVEFINTTILLRCVFRF